MCGSGVQRLIFKVPTHPKFNSKDIRPTCNLMYFKGQQDAAKHLSALLKGPYGGPLVLRSFLSALSTNADTSRYMNDVGGGRFPK